MARLTDEDRVEFTQDVLNAYANMSMLSGFKKQADTIHARITNSYKGRERTVFEKTNVIGEKPKTYQFRIKNT